MDFNHLKGRALADTLCPAAKALYCFLEMAAKERTKGCRFRCKKNSQEIEVFFSSRGVLPNPLPLPRQMMPKIFLLLHVLSLQIVENGWLESFIWSTEVDREEWVLRFSTDLDNGRILDDLDDLFKNGIAWTEDDCTIELGLQHLFI